jgi:hypothetical protein
VLGPDNKETFVVGFQGVNPPGTVISDNMTAEGWKTVSVREETKEIIDLIAEEEEMTIGSVIDSSVSFVFEEFYTKSRESDPQLRVDDRRQMQITRKDENVEIEL